MESEPDGAPPAAPGPDARPPTGTRPNPERAPDVSSPMHALAADARLGDSPMPLPPPTVAKATVRARPAAADDLLEARSGTDFDTLFAAHYERLVRALSLVAGDAETAADAVQEAFVKAHLRWRKVSSYDDPIGWVRRVAINQIRDGHRRRARKDRALLRLASREQAVASPSDIDEFDRLLATLPKQQRAATALYYVDGLSVAEIAVALDLAEGSVKSHLHDARRRLRPILEREAATGERQTAPPRAARAIDPAPAAPPAASPVTPPAAPPSSRWERP